MDRPSEKQTTTRETAASRGATEQIDRRAVVRKGAKAAYVIPVVLAAIKANENPVIAQTGPIPG